MLKHTVTFRLDEAKTRALDAISESLDRDRSYILNDAIDQYLEVHRWQVEHIEASLHEAEIGRFSSESEVQSTLKRFLK